MKSYLIILIVGFVAGTIFSGDLSVAVLCSVGATLTLYLTKRYWLDLPCYGQAWEYWDELVAWQDGWRGRELRSYDEGYLADYKRGQKEWMEQTSNPRKNIRLSLAKIAEGVESWF